MGKRDVQVTEQGGCGGGCARSLLLIWFIGGLAVVLGLPLLGGGTNGAGGAAIGLFGAGALIAALWLPWVIGLVVLVLVNLVVRPSRTVVIQERPRTVSTPPVTAGSPRSESAAPVQPSEIPVADTKVCPDCAETVKAAARICRFCGHRFIDSVAPTRVNGVGSPSATAPEAQPAGRSDPTVAQSEPRELPVRSVGRPAEPPAAVMDHAEASLLVWARSNQVLTVAMLALPVALLIAFALVIGHGTPPAAVVPVPTLSVPGGPVAPSPSALPAASNPASASPTTTPRPTARIVGSYRAGESPDSLAFDGMNIWVTNPNANTVRKLDAATGVVRGTYKVGSYPLGLVFDGANIWVANSNSNSVTKIAAATGAVVGTYRVGVYPGRVTFDGTNIWVANWGSAGGSGGAPGNVMKLDPATGAVVVTYDVADPFDMVSAGTSIWITNGLSNKLVKLDAATGKVIGTYRAGVVTNGAVAFDGTNIWVASYGADSVTKVLADTGAVVGTYRVGSYPSGLAFDGTDLWVTNSDSRVTEVAAATGAIVGTYPTGAYPSGVIFDGTSIWVANSNSNTVTKLLISP